MSKITSLLIGLVIVLNGVHLMPGNAMAKGMTMTHCQQCTEEDKAADYCKPPASEKQEDAFKDLFPLKQNCDCDFKPEDSRHQTAIAPFSKLTTKEKQMAAHMPESMHVTDLRKRNFHTSKQINAPPHAYMGALSTVQQLK